MTGEFHSKDYYAIEGVLAFVDGNPGERPSLSAMAAVAGMTKDRFEKIFRDFAGVSPFRFLDIISCEYTKPLLDSMPVLNASLSAGLSGPGRLHDLFVRVHGATPGEFKSGGRGLVIRYGSAPSPFGECLVAYTPKGISHVFFLPQESSGSQELAEIRKSWPHAEFMPDPRGAEQTIARIFGVWDKNAPFDLHIKGTNFQINVWKALLRIPEGSLSTYARIAQSCGNESAVRAAAGAVAANPVSYLIPCHRVIRSNGQLHKYRWGKERKQLMLGGELSGREL